jgi:hypothetical protein
VRNGQIVPIYKRNSIGIKPSYIEVVQGGHVIENRSGRRKIIEISEKGMYNY